MGIRRRTPYGSNGGRRVEYEFWFAPMDGGLYPSESDKVKYGRVDTEILHYTYRWAFDQMEENDWWLVFQLGGSREQCRERAKKRRAAIWRSAEREGRKITSQLLFPNIYFALVDDDAPDDA